MEVMANTPTPHLWAAARRVVHGCRGNEDEDCMVKRAPATTTPTTGDKPSTWHPPLRALARRVDQVVMAMSTTPRMPPMPTTLSCLPMNWWFCFS
jgi:hypothetical protein